MVNLTTEVATGDSTLLLLQTALQRGHTVWITGVADVGMDHADRILARACPAHLDDSG